MGNLILDCTCPICKKNFIPAPEHRWTIKTKHNPKAPVCSYSCMRKWEIPRLEAEKRKLKRRKGHLENEL